MSLALQHQVQVLHVDDDPSITDLTGTFLERESDQFTVEAATSADEGLEIINDNPPDCVVSDYNMPGMDGIEFLQAVREGNPDLPFILFTGKGSEAVASEAIAADVTDYLQKDSGAEQYELLANRIYNAVQAQREAKRADRQEQLMRLTEFAGDTGGFELDRESETVLLTAGTRRIISRPDQHEISLQEAIELFHPSDREDIQQTLSKTFERDEEVHRTWRLQPGDGDERLLDLTIIPVFENGEVTKLRGAGHDITERTEFKKQLRRNDRRFGALFNDPNLLVGLLELDGTLIDTNETSMEYVDAEREDVINEPFWTTPWWPPEIQPLIREKIEQAAAGRYVEYEADLAQPDGDQYTVTGMIRPVTNESGDVTSLIVSARDVTERVRRERILDAILEHTTVPMFLKNRAGEYILINQGFRDLFGLNDTEVRGHTDDELFEPEMATEVRQNDNQVLETGESVETEERIIVDGKERMYLSSKTPVYDIGTDSNPDDPVAIFGVASDITERKEREQEITRLNQLHQTVLSNIRETVVVTDNDGEFTYICPNIHFIFGYEASEVDELGSIKPLFDERLIEPGELEGEVTNIETTITDKSGNNRTVLVTVRQVDIEDGSRLYSIRDITDRNERRRELERTTQYLEIVLETAGPAFLKRADGRYQVMNTACKELLGLDPDRDITGLADYDLFPDDIAEQFRADDQRVIEAGEPIEIEEDVPTADGTKTYQTNKRPLFDERGNVETICAVSTDITARKKREQELQAKKQKLERQNERLDEFASVVSHDLRNPLRVADGYLELIRGDCESDHIDDVARALDRMDTLIEDLLTLAREGDQVGELEPVVLAELIENCWQNIAAPEAEMVVGCDRTVRADRSRLQQLLANLLRNAVEHGGADVTITIGELEAGFYVGDDGPGIPDENRDGVFEAGYSTSSEDTGFGLRIVKQVADAHGWEVAVSEGEQGGARFEITGVEFADW